MSFCSSDDLTSRSDSLHEQVHQLMSEECSFITDRSGAPFCVAYDHKASYNRAYREDFFDRLAIEIACFQYDWSPPIQRLYQSAGIGPRDIQSVSQIPAVPTDAFKLLRIACHSEKFDKVVFKTSGTTIGMRGKHHLRTTETYRIGARNWGKKMLCPDTDSLYWIILAPPYRLDESSSLVFMLDDFASQFGSGVTWAMQQSKFDFQRIFEALDSARQHQLPVIIAGASFAFVHFLEQLEKLPKSRRTQLRFGSSIDPRDRIMITGGFKGKTRELLPHPWRLELSRRLQVDSQRIISEYGMTELSSQAYDAVVYGEEPLIFYPPPWMRVVAVDPQTLVPVADGRDGIARIVDLANIDTALVVQTADRVRAVAGGFELLGRLASAPPRGCSIGIDEILGNFSINGGQG